MWVKTDKPFEDLVADLQGTLNTDKPFEDLVADLQGTLNTVQIMDTLAYI